MDERPWSIDPGGPINLLGPCNFSRVASLSTIIYYGVSVTNLFESVPD